MNSLHAIFEDILAEAYESGKLPREKIRTVTAEVVESTLPGIAEDLCKTLKRRAPQMLREHRDLEAGFRQRHQKRWRKALDHLEVMWVMAEEAGREFILENLPEEGGEDYQLEALMHVHARALLVVREIMCLLQGGLADGALSRWRTLHELTAIATFLQENDAAISHRYLASFDFNALRAAEQIRQYADRDGYDPLSPEDVEAIRGQCEEWAGMFGQEMRHEYGWAAPALGNRNPKFSDIEKAANLDLLRPRYKWASQHNHGGHRPAGTMLGSVESDDGVLLVGQSNAGLTDPIMMTANSLASVSCALLTCKPSFDNLLVMRILVNLSGEAGPLAEKLERESLARARRRSRRGGRAV